MTYGFTVRFPERNAAIEARAKQLMASMAKEMVHAEPEDITWEWKAPLLLQATFPFKGQHEFELVPGTQMMYCPKCGFISPKNV